MKPWDIAGNSEHSQQAAFFCWTQLPEVRNAPVLGLLSTPLLFAVPNGGKRDKITASKLKAEGVKAGTSDVLFLCQAKHYSGLALEFKWGRNKLTVQQSEFMHALHRQGYCCNVVWSWQQAANFAIHYLTGGDEAHIQNILKVFDYLNVE